MALLDCLHREVEPYSPLHKIAVYGGAFNPIHNGHIAVIKYLAERPDIDRVYVMPSSVHPFGKKLLDFETRKELIEDSLMEDAILKRFWLENTIEVVDIEKEIAQADSTFKGYTYQVLKYLKNQNPDAEISFCMGADNIEDMLAGKWDMDEQLAAEFGLIVAGRGSLPTANYACYSWYDGGADFLDVSSTRIRKSLENLGTDKQAIFLCPKAIQGIVRELYSKKD